MWFPFVTAHLLTQWKTSREWIDYTSASLTSRGLHEFKYGKFEILILNQALRPAEVDPSHTKLPMRFEVDWVRVYQH